MIMIMIMIMTNNETVQAKYKGAQNKYSKMLF